MYESVIKTAGTKTEKRSLETMVMDLGFEEAEKFHNGGNDAMWTLKAFEKMVEVEKGGKVALVSLSGSKEWKKWREEEKERKLTRRLFRSSSLYRSSLTELPLSSASISTIVVFSGEFGISFFSLETSIGEVRVLTVSPSSFPSFSPQQPIPVSHLSSLNPPKSILSRSNSSYLPAPYPSFLDLVLTHSPIQLLFFSLTSECLVASIAAPKTQPHIEGRSLGTHGRWSRTKRGRSETTSLHFPRRVTPNRNWEPTP